MPMTSGARNLKKSRQTEEASPLFPYISIRFSCFAWCGEIGTEGTEGGREGPRFLSPTPVKLRDSDCKEPKPQALRYGDARKEHPHRPSRSGKTLEVSSLVHYNK